MRLGALIEMFVILVTLAACLLLVVVLALGGSWIARGILAVVGLFLCLVGLLKVIPSGDATGLGLPYGFSGTAAHQTAVRSTVRIGETIESAKDKVGSRAAMRTDVQVIEFRESAGSSSEPHCLEWVFSDGSTLCLRFGERDGEGSVLSSVDVWGFR